MAKIKSYTDSRGVSYDTAYWRLTSFDVNLITKKANFTFSGYKDVNARNSGKDAIGTKNYFINDDTKFDYYFNKHINDGLNLAQIAYLIATETLEHVGDEIIDGVLTPIQKSFFHGAEDSI